MNTVNKKIEQRIISTQGLLNAARLLFVSQGYQATNLEQIATSANLTKGAIYFYFKSKEAVLLELLKQVEKIVLDDAIEHIQSKSSQSPLDQLIAYIHFQTNLGITNIEDVLLLILMSLEFKMKKSATQEFLGKMYSRQCEFMESLILKGQLSGDFRNDLPAKELTSIVLGAHDGTFLEWYKRSEALNGRDLARSLRNLIIKGLKNQ
jgi:AcrR family transcriptional regulator